MEIRNEYTSFNNKKYHDHTHHITKCLQEEQSSRKTQAGGAGLRNGQARGKVNRVFQGWRFLSYERSCPGIVLGFCKRKRIFAGLVGRFGR